MNVLGIFKAGCAKNQSYGPVTLPSLFFFSFLAGPTAAKFAQPRTLNRNHGLPNKKLDHNHVVGVALRGVTPSQI